MAYCCTAYVVLTPVNGPKLAPTKVILGPYMGRGIDKGMSPCRQFAASCDLFQQLRSSLNSCFVQNELIASLRFKHDTHWKHRQVVQAVEVL